MESGVVSKPHRLDFDVFLSFRGEDTRDNFAGRLYEALKEKVRVFRDNEGMKRSNEICSSLAAGMEDSATSVIVLSPKYADSHWCLDELAMLCDLKSSLDRRMLPIFYKVDPSHVRKQSGHFAKDFEKLAERFSEEKIQRWRGAMKLVGNLAGYVCKEDSDEDDMIELVVKSVLAELSNTTEKVGEYIVGLESPIEDLMNLFDTESSSGVQVLGLYGMGGIGKTTLAKAFYNKIVGNFKQRAFISNVREGSSAQDGLVNLQKTLIKELFRFVPQIKDVSRGLENIKENVHEKKIIVVLDDVDHIDQVNALVGETRWYGEGTLIVITTRDEEILSNLSVNQQYEVKCLTEMQALKLFSYHSLRKEKPTDSLLELSKKFVQISGLLPLAVEVFGSLLYDKKEAKDWQTQLDKLKNTQPSNLQDVLALSFDSLDDEEKKVFLDIACLFLKMEITKEEVVDVLKGCGLNAEAALRVLRQKSLVKILADDTLWMHDQIRDMGRQMVFKESREDPGMRSILWDRGEIMTVLNNMKGTSSIRGIVFDFKKKFARDPTADEIASMNLHNNPGINSVFNYLKNKFVRFPAEEKPKSSEFTIPVEPFVPMTKLRLLQINNVELEGNLKLLPSELKWIQWKGCPLENLPLDFLARQLAVLDLSESGIRRVQTLCSKRVNENLKVLIMRGCHSLEAIPDLSNHNALEKLVFERCKLLVKVPRSVGNLRKLLHLDFRSCSKVAEFLVDVSGLKLLEKLFLSGCSDLSVLPENIGAMTSLKELLLDGTAIKNLPESINRLQNLEKLSLRGCRSIQELPLCVGTLKSLEKLYLDDTALKNLPGSIGDLKNLQTLHLVRCTSLSTIPDTINELKSLKTLFINGSAVDELPLKPSSLPCLTDFSAGDCKYLKQLPRSIGGLNSLLQLQLDSTPIETLPKEIGDLHFIRKLELRNCKFLKFLPKSIGDMDTLYSLNLQGSNIEELPEDFGKLKNLVVLRMNNCKMLKRLPESFGDLKSLHHLYMQETLVAELPESFRNLSNLKVLKMLKKPRYRISESDAPGTREEPRFVEVPNSFSNLLLLEELDARSWRIWGKIPDVLEKLSSLKILNLGNNYFHSLPSSLVGLSNLKELSLCDSRELKHLPPLPCKLEHLILANCFSLESVSDLSELAILQDLNLTNCEKVVDIPGLEHLMALKRLYMNGCNSSYSLAVKKRLSKASLKMLRNLSLPGNRVPDWFSQGPVTFSAQPNRELRGVILAVVVALNHETENDDYQLPDVLEVQAQFLKLDHNAYTHTLHLSGVPRTSNDQLHICRYSAFHPMVMMLKDGYTIQVIKRNPPIKQGVELKMHGIHLVYEDDDDLKGKENTLPETQLTVSQKLANFFSSFEEGETSSEVDSTVTLRKDDGLNLRKDDDFLSETNSGATPELQYTEEKKQENISESSTMVTYEETQIQSPKVFLNYRGAELRQSFIAHLEMALIRGGVNVYVDRGEHRGINRLFEGIEESSVALVILSERYTESSWCLDELVKIAERVEQGKLMAIPIFYKLEPSQVRRLDGDFGSYLWDLGKRTEFDKLKRWKEALVLVSNTVGVMLNKKKRESAFIDDIVEYVHMALSFLPKDDGLNLRKDDDFISETDSGATPELQNTEEKKQENVSESSTMVTYDQKHKVFINFRGSELRHGFVDHFKEALKRNGVSVFEEEIELRGEDLGNLLKRIEEVKIALIIFSSRYTKSAWCLNELVKIKELMDVGKLVAIPIFYKVEPSQVIKLEGVFGDDFRTLCRMDRDHHIITSWIEALKSIASKLGFYLNKHTSESEIITHIVKEVLKISRQQEGKKPSLFGMEQRMEQLEKKLDFDGNDTQIIGVVGMPGIGKTTLAMMLHEKWKRKFIRCVLFLDIHKKSKDYGPVWLRKTLLELLLEGKVPEIGDETTHGSVNVELLKTKIFALLDDVREKKQLEFLLGELDWIKKGSKIIITTCDKSLLEGFADDMYVVPKLNNREAFQLFSYQAFHDQICNSTSTLLRLSRMFVAYARGHPLALKILGSELYGKDEVYWASKLEMMTKQSNVMLQDVWREPIDLLSEKQEDVFLDIVCFFKSEDEYFVRSLLDSGDPDSTDAVSEVKDLVNKFLITIADGRVEMSGPLNTLSMDLGSPRWLRLWNYKDIINELMQMKKSGANNVRGIFLDTSKLTKSMCLDISTFTDMRNLRYMKIYDSCCPRQCKAECKLNFPDGLEFPLGEVRYLHWVKFPLEELPPEFRPENLVDLRLPYSKITRVWEGEKDTPRLKWVDLSHSSELLDLSALSKAENLRRLNLEGCTSLDLLPVEIQNMKSLVFLNLRGCIRLWSLPKMNLISLKTLILSDCSNLEEFQLISESIEFLHLDGTAIKGLPQAIQKLQRLVVLNLKNCKMLVCLPNCLGNLKALEKLILSGCSRLKNLLDVRNGLKHLQILLFDETGAKEMPSISLFTRSEGPGSADMFLQPLGSHCNVSEWPCGVNGVSSLRRLCLSRNDFVSLQPDIGKLYNLKWLDVKHCKKLRSVPMLPPRLQYFDAHGCNSLQRVANPVAFSVSSDQIHATFNFSNCNKLDRDSQDNIISYTRWRSQLVLNELTQYSGGLVSEALVKTCFPGWEVPAWFSHRAYGSVLKPKLPAHWCDNKLTGIGLCAVIVFDGYHNQRKRVLLKCNCEFKNEDGSSNRFSCTIGGWSELVSSHVFIGFTNINKTSEEDNEENCVSTETFIEFEVTDGMEEIKGCEVVECGFSLVYAPEER